MVQNGFYYAACKNSERIAKENVRKNKISDAFYDICRKYDTDIYGLTKSMLTKKEYEQILKFLSMMNYPLRLYPNLQ